MADVTNRMGSMNCSLVGSAPCSLLRGYLHRMVPRLALSSVCAEVTVGWSPSVDFSTGRLTLPTLPEAMEDHRDCEGRIEPRDCCHNDKSAVGGNARAIERDHSDDRNQPRRGDETEEQIHSSGREAKQLARKCTSL